MALFQSPRIITDGLVFAYDISNGKSNVGAPLTNLLPTPSVNGYPTIGNSWGTFNTNQYGSGTYFSIGTVSSVSGNIVTMSSAHSLRTYDVMQPQTTGGGVTSGTNYLIKKLSDTTFCLYPYNNSQDGSQGYINPLTGNHKVYDDMEADNKISINATSFPTMWWGYPHLPNSGLVKEIITKGFNGIPGRTPTDCIRLHYIRSDGVKDGMAYGVDATVTVNVPHTISFWTKSVDASAVGNTISYQIYNYGDGPASGYSFTFTLGPVGVWQKQSMTFTPTDPYCISYWFGQGSGTYKWDLSNIQFESGSVANNFAAGTRSTTQAVVDLTGNNTWTVNNLTYAADGTFSFNGSNSWIESSTSSLFDSQAVTMEYWCKPTATAQYGLLFEKGQVNTQYSNFFNGDGIFYFRTIGLSPQDLTFASATYITANQWNHIVCVVGSGTKTVYINGVQRYQQTGVTGSMPTGQTNQYVGKYGNAGNNYPFSGSIAVSKVYNRALTESEVQQNFNALRGRYGI